jgi:hypothetical protein
VALAHIMWIKAEAIEMHFGFAFTMHVCNH